LRGGRLRRIAFEVKVREGQVANRSLFDAIGVTLDGERENLGLWARPAVRPEVLDGGADRPAQSRRSQTASFMVCDELKCV